MRSLFLSHSTAPRSLGILRRQIYRQRKPSSSRTVTSRTIIQVPTTATIDENSTRYPSISSCPGPTCSCTATPSGLDIKSGPMAIPRYTKHVVISTGQDDWASRIENEEGHDGTGSRMNVARELKKLVGKGGRYHDSGNSILITNSSLLPPEPPDECSITIFPSGITFPKITLTLEAIEVFARQHLLGTEPLRTSTMLESGMLQQPAIFICSHKTRDSRCGIMGPLLYKTFCERLGLGNSHVSSESTNPVVAMVSHIGGHAWAGNVIIYFPPTFKLPDKSLSPLAGQGVWYGRVEPRHVEGIVSETLVNGRIIEDLLRGVTSWKAQGSVNQ